MKKEISDLYIAFADLIRSFDFKNGYFEFRTVILQSGKNKDISNFQTYLIKVKEDDVWPKDYEKEIEIRKKCKKCLLTKANIKELSA